MSLLSVGLGFIDKDRFIEVYLTEFNLQIIFFLMLMDLLLTAFYNLLIIFQCLLTNE